MWLPYPKSQPGLSEAEWTPKDFLSRDIACPECGRASAYTVRDVRWGAGEDPIMGQESFACWSIDTVCNEQSCELAIGFHWLTGGQSGPEEIRFLTLRLFEREFFKNLRCGRGHLPGTRIPSVRRVG